MRVSTKFLNLVIDLTDSRFGRGPLLDKPPCDDNKYRLCIGWDITLFGNREVMQAIADEINSTLTKEDELRGKTLRD